MDWTISIVNNHPTTRLRHSPFIEAIKRLLRWKRRRSAEITVIFVTGAFLRDLNRAYLQHDYETDVVTFPLEENPLEGEIYISIEQIRHHVQDFGVTFYNEAERLVIHGMLHLLGYNDVTEEERSEMRKLEDRFLTVADRVS